MGIVNGLARSHVVSGHRAFTLVEIAVAVSIFAFAIVAIMGLFPVALRSANDSRVESIVTQIARTVLSDLRTGAFDKARIVTGPTPDQPGIIPNPRKDAAFTAVDLKTASAVPTYLKFDSIGQVLGTVATDLAPVPSADFLVKIEWLPVGATTQVTVTVETPAAAPLANRSQYPVATLMGDTR